MFTFSPGFEAASLKWHSKDQEDENLGSNNNKKQMIGFARFHTRLEAMEAVEVLNGKRVDQERGTLLKAEMAKKNLHIKRGSVVPTQAAATAAAAVAASVAANGGSSNGNAGSGGGGTTATTANGGANESVVSPLSILSKKMHLPPSYDSFSPLPSDLLSPIDYYKTDPFAKDPFQNGSVPATPLFNDPLFGLRSQSFDARSIDLMSPPRGFGLIPPSRMTQAMQETTNMTTNATTITTTATTATTNSTNPVDPFDYLSKSSPVPTERAFSTSSPTSSLLGNNNTNMTDNGPSIISRRLGSLSIQTGGNFPTDFRSPSLSSPSYNTSTTTSTTTNNNNSINNRPINPADQNPPCNTLYVGNLPANTGEDELRSLFSKCHAFKRMSFRNKAQGPMCFVEFEDVQHATQAMNELQGHCLSNSIKGGIRLSFSKNPLFIKPNKTTSTNGTLRETFDVIN
ncbi:hypothetical protein K492DRAFT_188836 [Lichtheimia hyalospora FSU 10163]|nr:hypothetical protein K492DRAFT_188836 [Lichtheimia hyalospora FSU 10163]